MAGQFDGFGNGNMRTMVSIGITEGSTDDIAVLQARAVLDGEVGSRP
jgi:hypothetical protein